MKKKPNYKLRRTVAKIILVLLLLLPIVLINKTKIMHIPIYLAYSDNMKTVDALFESGYKTEEAEELLNYLYKNKKISEKTSQYILKLNSKGYKKYTTTYILKNLNEKQIIKFLSKNYNKEFEKYIKIDLFDYSKYNRYVNYKKDNPFLKLDDVVTQIELNLDKDYYEDSVEEKNPDSITCLVNKYRYLSENYEPKDLVDMEDGYANNKYGTKKMLRKEAYEEFKKMVDTAKKEGISFYAESSYRTYKYQEDIYNSYVKASGKAEANKYAAVPGYSEHQTGLAVDLANIWTIKKDSDEYRWINNNAHKFGYIIRYKDGKENLTGFNAEAWHIRYVGKKAAKIIHDKDITFDEYYVKYIQNKKSNQ